MHPCRTLPKNYREYLHIDLQKDKKLMVLVNGLSLLILISVVTAGLFLVPVTELLEGGILPLLALIIGNFLYLILHELVHGILMWTYSGARPFYGFTGLYAYAGSDAYFDYRHYLIIALAPVVFWGVVLAALCVLAYPTRWFWPCYFIEAVNLCSAAGDLYVAARFARLPKDMLVQDNGIAMTVYLPEK